VSKYTDHDGFIHVDGIKYVLAEPIVWDLGFKGSGLQYVVPKGIVFDCSVPWFLWLIFSPHDKRYLKASAMHDHMLKAGWSRVEAAGPFERALAADNTPAWRRFFMFLSVALFRYH